MIESSPCSFHINIIVFPSNQGLKYQTYPSTIYQRFSCFNCFFFRLYYYKVYIIFPLFQRVYLLPPFLVLGVPPTGAAFPTAVSTGYIQGLIICRRKRIQKQKLHLGIHASYNFLFLSLLLLFFFFFPPFFPFSSSNYRHVQLSLQLEHNAHLDSQSYCCIYMQQTSRLLIQ